MKRTLFAAILFCLALPVAGLCAERPRRLPPAQLPPSSAPAILSIVPAQAEPGGRVMLFGSGFGEAARVFLGSVEMATKTADGTQAEFFLPAQMQPGLYALYLKRADGINTRPYNFTVLPLRPVITGLSPDRISVCDQGKDRDVTVHGQHFNEGSLVLFDGAGVKGHLVSSEALVLTVPQAAGGVHQISVHSPPDSTSLPMALTIETRPEISQVTMGSEHVNYYELVIEGKNFQANSALNVDGQRIGGRGGAEVSEREQLIYLDCGKLIYQRHPYSPVTKEFRIQVVNPGGEASQTVNVTAP